MATRGNPTETSSWVLAVDFGTSSTTAAIGRDGGAELVGVDGGLPRMLSNVFLQESTGKLLLGDVAENASTLAPWCFERCPKVKLGQQYMLLGDQRVLVTEAVGKVIGKVAADAVRMRGGERPAAVRLTHPVRWGEEKRNALRDAARAAGLENPELVLEPVAAAIHYAHERLSPGEHVAVYDLGGGTLDTAVLRCTEEDFEVIGEPHGRDGFGGEDFDDRLYRFLGEQLPHDDWLRLRAEPEEDGDTSWPKANRQFRRNVRRAKELLTHNDQVDVDVPAPVNRALTLTIDQLKDLICTDIEESVRALELTIGSAGLKPDQLDAIYLAGGSSQIPLVSQVIFDRLGVMPLHLNDSKAVICLGAALGRHEIAAKGNGSTFAAAGGNGGAPAASPGIGAVTEVDSAVGGPAAPITDPTVVDLPGPPEPAVGATALAQPVDRTEVATGQTTELDREGAAATLQGGTQISPPDLLDDTGSATVPGPLSGTVASTVVESAALPATEVGGDAPERGQPALPAGPEPQRDRAKPASPDAEQIRRRRLIAGVGDLLVLIAVVAVIALALGGGSQKKKPAVANGAHTLTAQFANSGELSLNFGAPWRAGGSSVTGADLVGQTGTGPAGKPILLTTGSVTLAAGPLLSSAAIPGGAPPGLVAHHGPPASTISTKIGGHNAEQYIWAPTGQRLEAYVLPTAGGDVAIICQAVNPSASLGCDALVQQATVAGGNLLAPGPVTSFGAALGKQLGPALSARSAIGRLGDPSFSARVGKAQRVAAADAAAASAVAATSTPARYGSQIASVVRALRAESGAFTALADVAKAGKRGAYGGAAGAVNRASAALASAVAAFAAAGLHLPTVSKFALAGPPAPPTLGGTSSQPTFTAPSSPTPSSPAPSSPGPSYSAPSPSPAPSLAPSPAPTPSPGCSGTCTGGGA